MKYFNNLKDEDINRFFYRNPIDFNNKSNKDFLKYCLGAVLYIPCVKYEMILKCFEDKKRYVNSIAICMEDAISEKGRELAFYNINNMVKYIDDLLNIGKEIPLIFIRPKDLEMLVELVDVLKKSKGSITGIILPKATPKKIQDAVEILKKNNLDNLYILPIIETEDFLDLEKKDSNFRELKIVLSNYNKNILNVRVGATDILGIQKIRRESSLTIYDNVMYRNFIGDLLAITNSIDEDIIVSGAVSEYFNLSSKEVLDIYIKEINLDKFNGIVGKTVIHPNQAKVVQAMMPVTYEDYMDSINILSNNESECAVFKGKLNRMNEINPHKKWAEKTLILAEIYGVLHEGVIRNELIELQLQN